MKNNDFNYAELVEWGYETGGDFDEAMRVYSEHNPEVVKYFETLTPVELAVLEKKFNSEYRDENFERGYK